MGSAENKEANVRRKLYWMHWVQHVLDARQGMCPYLQLLPQGCRLPLKRRQPRPGHAQLRLGSGQPRLRCRGRGSLRRSGLLRRLQPPLQILAPTEAKCEYPFLAPLYLPLLIYLSGGCQGPK